MRPSFKLPEEKLRKEKIIEMMNGLYTIRKKQITQNHYEKLLETLPYPSIKEIEQLFGSWDGLQYSIGNYPILKTTPLPDPPHSTKTVSKKPVRWSAEKSLKKYLVLCGKRISIKEYESLRKSYPKMMGSHGIIYYYGTWKNAILKNGLLPKSTFTNEECLLSLKQAYCFFGERLSSKNYTEWSREHQAPSLSLIIHRFNSWNEAIAEVRKLMENE